MDAETRQRLNNVYGRLGGFRRGEFMTHTASRYFNQPYAHQFITMNDLTPDTAMEDEKKTFGMYEGALVEVTYIADQPDIVSTISGRIPKDQVRIFDNQFTSRTEALRVLLDDVGFRFDLGASDRMIGMMRNHAFRTIRPTESEVRMRQFEHEYNVNYHQHNRMEGFRNYHFDTSRINTDPIDDNHDQLTMEMNRIESDGRIELARQRMAGLRQMGLAT